MRVAVLAAACACAGARGAARGTVAPVAPDIKIHGCMPDNVTHLPFCDTTLDAAARARDLRARLTLEEKLCLMDRLSCAVPRLGLPQ